MLGTVRVKGGSDINKLDEEIERIVANFKASRTNKNQQDKLLGRVLAKLLLSIYSLLTADDFINKFTNERHKNRQESALMALKADPRLTEAGIALPRYNPNEMSYSGGE